jgi:NADPH-dependent 2,4-dienoyl-CoA reductase/sulfur reductase-like enzyme
LLSGGALAVSGLAAARMWRRTSIAYDVVVVGGGVAGIAAARSVRAAGGSVVILDTTDRLGGRIADDSVLSTRSSELYSLVSSSGIPTIPATSVGTQFPSTYSAMFAALHEKGERIRGGLIPDESVYDAVRDFSERPGFRATLAHLGIWDDHRNPASLLDYHLVARRSGSALVFPAHGTLLVPSGLRDFIVSLAAGIPVGLGARVISIAYGNNGAVLRTANGDTYRARETIVTASIDVLASGGIDFDPPLPETTTSAIAALPINPGGVSYATVGNAGAREVLGRPVDNTLRFAGEATAPAGLGCVEGAWASAVSGHRSARNAFRPA